MKLHDLPGACSLASHITLVWSEAARRARSAEDAGPTIFERRRYICRIPFKLACPFLPTTALHP